MNIPMTKRRWVAAALAVAAIGLFMPWAGTPLRGSTLSALDGAFGGRVTLVILIVGAAASFAERWISEVPGLWTGAAAGAFGLVFALQLGFEAPSIEAGLFFTLTGSALALGLAANRLKGLVARGDGDHVAANLGRLLVVIGLTGLASGVLPTVDVPGVRPSIGITRLLWWPAGVASAVAVGSGLRAANRSYPLSIRWRYLLFGSLGAVGGVSYGWTLADALNKLGLPWNTIGIGAILPLIGGLAAPVVGLFATRRYSSPTSPGSSGSFGR